MRTDIRNPNESFRGGDQRKATYIGSPHMHDNYELALYLEREIHVINGAFDAILPAPLLILHRPYTLHHVVPTDIHSRIPYRRYVYNCSQSFLRGIDPSYVDIDRVFCEDVRIFRLSDAQLDRLLPLAELLSERRDNRRQRRFLFCALLLEIERMDATPVNTAPDKTLAYISAVTRYLTEHYAEAITAADIAAMHFISVPKLNRDFRRCTQTTIHEMLLRIRLQKAAESLAAGVSVTDTAHRCGFVNESHFIRTFRGYFGTTPLKWAKSQGKEE